jgi:peptidoglycan hydrolase-like protein with peptidoglycan-binding domain/DNA invertase Pin-like site-specific DNA recombinase
MQSTSRRLAARAALGALTCLLVLLVGAGVAGASEPPRLATTAGALAQGAGLGDRGEAQRVRAIQRVLAKHGWAPGPVDGLYGPATEAAVVRFQTAAGLTPDGIVGRHTARALNQARTGLRRGAGYQTADGSDRVRALQRRLARAGYRPGPVDGRFGPRTEAALARLQHAARLTASGAVDTPTRRLLARHTGTGQPDSRPVTADLKQLGPRVLGSVTIRPLAASADQPASADVWLVVLFTAAALLVGMLCGGLWSRSRSRLSDGPADEPHHDEPRPQPSQERLSPAPDPAQTEMGEREARPPLRAVQYASGPKANGHDTRASQPGDNGPQQLQPQPPQPTRHLLAVGQAPRPEPRPEPQLVAAEPDRSQERPVRAVGYVSVPSAHVGDGGLLEAQAEAIGRLCARRGWQLLHVVRDTENGHPKGMERPGLLYALERIAQGEASCLVVSELERLSRSAADLGRIVDWLDQRDGRLVAIDLRLDTGSAQGRLTARTLVAVGQWEGRRIAEQTKKGLAAARARRATTGRPAVEDIPALKQRIQTMRRAGMTLQAIADQLNQQNTPTLRGGREWRPSSVQAAAGYRRPKPKHNQPKHRKP